MSAPKGSLLGWVVAGAFVILEHFALAAGLVPPIFSLLGSFLFLFPIAFILWRCRRLPWPRFLAMSAALSGLVLLPLLWNWPMRLAVRIYGDDLHACLRSGRPARIGPIKVIKVDQRRSVLVTLDNGGPTGLWLNTGKPRGIFFGSYDLSDDWTFAQED